MVLDGILVAVEPVVVVVELNLHVQLDVVDSVLGRGPVEVDVGQGVMSALDVSRNLCTREFQRFDSRGLKAVPALAS